MNILPQAKREQIIALLVEGNSLRGTARVAGVSYNAVLQFLPKIGQACADYQDQVLRNLPCKKLQLDEIWSFCHTKNKNLTPKQAYETEYGDVWTFIAIDPETKLVPCWRNGKRSLETTYGFIRDLRERVIGKPQITTDGFRTYAAAIRDIFGLDVDYGMLIKIFEGEKTDPQTLKLTDRPGIHAHRMIGKPEAKSISTSIVERQNLTLRQNQRRFVRSTNAHSKKLENHGHAVALHFFHYHFCRIHQTLRITPAMAAGLSGYVWSLGEMVELMGVAKQLESA